MVDAAPPPELLQRVLSEAPVPVDELLCDSEAAALLACMSSGLLALASRADELEWAATKALRGAAKGSPEAAVPAAVAQVAADCRRLARRCLAHVVAASIWRMAIGVTVILAGAAYVALRCLEDALDRPTLLVTT